MSKAQWIAENLKPGEIYAGLVLGHDGAPDHHLILLPGEAEDINWKGAGAWAKQQGGDLPTRREQAILFGNLKHEFKPAWYWSGEQHAASSAFAWNQPFDHGGQLIDRKSWRGRARAVRRLAI